MTASVLPSGFEDLASWASEWALTNEQDRYRKLHSVRFEELRRFYEAMYPRMSEVLEFLDEYEVDALTGDAKTLFNLAMTFAETAHPVDLGWKDVDFPDAYPWASFEFRTVSCTGDQAACSTSPGGQP